MNHIPKPIQSIDGIEKEIICILDELRKGNPCEAKTMLFQLKRIGDYVEYTLTGKNMAERNLRLKRLGIKLTSAYKYVRVTRNFDNLKASWPPEVMLTRAQVFKEAERLGRLSRPQPKRQLHPAQSDPSEDSLPSVADEAGGKEGISRLQRHSIIDRLRNVQTWIERGGMLPEKAEIAFIEMEKAMPDGFRDYAQKRMAKIRR